MGTFPDGRTAATAFYGNPAGADGNLDPKWERANIIVVTLPYPMVTSWDNEIVHKVQFHKKAADALVAALTEIKHQVELDLRIEAKRDIPVEAMQHKMLEKFGKAIGTPENDKLVSGSYDAMVEAKLQTRLHTLGLDVLGGTFNFRKIRGASGLSTHSYGVAIDLDPGHNALGSTTGGMPPFAVTAFKKQGLTWGGDYKGRKDFMHFQACSGF